MANDTFGLLFKQTRLTDGMTWTKDMLQNSEFRREYLHCNPAHYLSCAQTLIDKWNRMQPTTWHYTLLGYGVMPAQPNQFFVMGTDPDTERVMMLTSKEFPTQLEAEAYAKTCAAGWNAFVVVRIQET